MKKEFTANILFLIAINIVVKPFYALAIDTTVQNVVGPESYGLFLALFNFTYIQQIFADLGIQNYNNRTISQDRTSLSDLLPKILGSKIIFTLFFVGIILITSTLFGYGKHLNEILVWIIATQASLSFLLYLRTNISGMGKYFTDSIFSVIDKLILIFILVYLLWIRTPDGGFEISHFVKAQFFSVFSTLIICFLYIHRKIQAISIRIQFSFIRKIFIKSLPYATLVLLMGAYSRLDTIMLEQLMNDNALEAGKYAASFRLYDTYNNFSFLFAVLLLPMFSKMIAEGEKVDILVNWTFRLLSLGSIYLIVLSYFFGVEILNIFYNREIDESYQWSFFFLILSTLPLSLNYVYGSLLTANGELQLLNFIAIGGFLINLILNFALIPYYGAPGAALTTLITQGGVLIFQINGAKRSFKLQLPLSIILKLSIIMIIGIAFTFIMRDKFDLGFGLIFWILTGAFILMAFLLKLIRKEDLMMADLLKK
jgi:O-antigen/teichoic acid export membrane protein